MTFAKAHKFIVTCYWERDCRPFVLSLQDVERKEEEKWLRFAQIGLAATKQPF